MPFPKKKKKNEKTSICRKSENRGREQQKLFQGAEHNVMMNRAEKKECHAYIPLHPPDPLICPFTLLLFSFPLPSPSLCSKG